MSRLHWAVFLAAIFGISSWLGNHGESHPFGGDFVAPVPPYTRGKVTEHENSVPALRQRNWLAVRFSLTPNVGEVAKPEGLLSPVSAVTSGTTSIKLSDIPVGKVIQIGELKFVKVGSDQYLSISPGCVDPVLTTTGAVKNFDYTGNVQSYTAYAGCEYKLEVWGGQGGSANSTYIAGYGGYAVGNMYANFQQTLYIVVGGKGVDCSNNSSCAGGYNGGGLGSSGGTYTGGGGGGATHIATVTGVLSGLSASKDSVIIVAGAGGTGGTWGGWGYGRGGNGGGYIGGNAEEAGGAHVGKHFWGSGGSQTEGGYGGGNATIVRGTFGRGADRDPNGGGGGGGWYGGGGAHAYGGGGGSGYINTNVISDAVMYCYTAYSATACSTSNVTNTKTIGTSSTGHAVSQAANTGNGYARITRLN